MKQMDKYLPLANLALAAVVLVLMVLDLFWPRWNIFLSGFVKALLLVFCLLSALNGWRLYARWRRARQARRNSYRRQRY